MPRTSAPALVSTPSLNGSGRVGTKVTVNSGKWSGRPTPSLTYSWLLDGKAISGATASSYTCLASDDRRSLSCQVTAQNASGRASATTAALTVTYAPPAAVGIISEEIFDQGSGAQTVATATAFSGAALTYSVSGAGATIHAPTGLVTIPTDAATSAVVTVKATNSGGTAEQKFQVTVEAPETGEPGISADTFRDPTRADSAWRMPLASMSKKNYASAPELQSLAFTYSFWAGVETPIYKAGSADKLVNVYYCDTWMKLYENKWQRWGNTDAVEAEIRAAAKPLFAAPYHQYVTTVASADGNAQTLPASYDPRVNPATPPLKIRAPLGMTTHASTDSVLVVWQPDGTVFESYASIVMKNGDIMCWTYKITDPSLGGDGWQNGTRASMVPLYAGVIRKHEWDVAEAAGQMAEGTAKEAALAAAIPHAIGFYGPAGILANRAVHPAVTVDRGALRESPAYSGANPMGARFALPAGFEVRGMGLTTPQGRAVAYALLKYGMIIVDRGGSGVCLFTEKAINVSYEWKYQSDLHQIRLALQKVTGIVGPFVSG